MLIEFSVQNFLSFKDKVTLSMEASHDKSLPENVIESAQGSKFNLLKSAAIYGANASGKSNLLKAMSFMKEYVVNSFKEKSEGDPTGVIPFKLDERFRDKPSIFETMFLINGIPYLYGFSLDSRQILEEWLHSYPENRKRLLFERDSNKHDHKNPANAYTFGPHWSGEAKRLANRTASNVLFISVAAQFEHSLAKRIKEWFVLLFEKIMNTDFRTVLAQLTLKDALDSEDFKKLALGFLKDADLGIADFQVDSVPILESVRTDYSRLLPKEPFNIINSVLNEFMTQLLSKIGKIEVSDMEALMATTLHEGKSLDGTRKLIPFELFEESDGTKKYFAILGPLLRAVVAGGCLYADELDVRLHPLLTRAIVDMFHDKKINKRGAQLIFTTHDVNLLDTKDLFRRDQIWLTEKDEQGGTQLFSLWDFKDSKIRKDENLKKGYLAGRYGGIPYIEKLLDTSTFGALESVSENVEARA